MKHTVLIGFKHAGKTSIGSQLSSQLEKNFIDLDEAIESEHVKNTDQKLTVRQIVLQEGLDKFRELENKVLQNVLNSSEQSIIASGGGTPLAEDNRKLLAEHFVVNIIADKSNIYERIMVNGRPAFFPDDEDPYLSFRKVWDERTKVYDSLAHVTISNNNSLDRAVNELKRILVI